MQQKRTNNKSKLFDLSFLDPLTISQTFKLEPSQILEFDSFNRIFLKKNVLDDLKVTKNELERLKKVVKLIENRQEALIYNYTTLVGICVFFTLIVVSIKFIYLMITFTFFGMVFLLFSGYFQNLSLNSLKTSTSRIKKKANQSLKQLLIDIVVQAKPRKGKSTGYTLKLEIFLQSHIQEIQAGTNTTSKTKGEEGVWNLKPQIQQQIVVSETMTQQSSFNIKRNQTPEFKDTTSNNNRRDKYLKSQRNQSHKKTNTFPNLKAIIKDIEISQLGCISDQQDEEKANDLSPNSILPSSFGGSLRGDNLFNFEGGNLDLEKNRKINIDHMKEQDKEKKPYEVKDSDSCASRLSFLTKKKLDFGASSFLNNTTQNNSIVSNLIKIPPKMQIQECCSHRHRPKKL